ncbi:alanine dehydrogenase [Bacteroidia bacterium]|nr:alanine dehydrogenase [Bacteroidia bacterium]GHU57622.1 alanine dehydrogenase [Bacteroidia bacterium]
MEATEGRQQQGAYIPHELLKELSKANTRLLIGIPRERGERERRLALTPEAVDMLTEAGHRILFESGAGLGINYSDSHFSEAGAEIVDTPDEVFQADLIIKVLPPLVAEVALMKPRTILFSMVQFSIFSQAAYEAMIQKRIHAISYELMTDRQKTPPILTLLSEIEGMAALTIASSLLSNQQGGKGVLLGGIPGIAPTELVIIGAGTAGTAAARAALGMGALVKVFDNDINKLRLLELSLGQRVFTSNFHPKVLQNAFHSADVVIGAMNYLRSHRRYLIAEELIHTMKKGALIIDLSTNQGGCFETTCYLTPADPEIFEQYGVLHYCRPNISNSVARTASMAFSNILVSMLISLGDSSTFQNILKEDDCFRSGVYMYNGKPVNSYISNHFNILSNNLDIYLTMF